MMAHFPLVCPPALKPGDRVAVVAPAGVCRAADLAPGLALLREFGLEPVLSEGLYRRNGYLAGADELRARALMAAFDDASIAGIVCARGGYGSLRLLSRLDFGRMAAHPKRLVGFSDLSALLWAVCRRAGLVCFGGPAHGGDPARRLDGRPGNHRGPGIGAGAGGRRSQRLSVRRKPHHFVPPARYPIRAELRRRYPGT
ncbi:MAG: LD-carboxypeptidase [Deltaproteobacteria bacterium]|nr:LD-carboxypeptidase [Deltaproteobacteria bacterium]